MVQVAGMGRALEALKASLRRGVFLTAATLVGVAILYSSCTARVPPNQFGVEQRKFGLKSGIVEQVYMPGLYLLPPGTTMHRFPREIHVLEASYDREESLAKAGAQAASKVVSYFNQRDRVLGDATHRVIEALNIQTSDGYAVKADVTVLYSIADPVKIAKEFGWGSLYVDSFVINTFRSGILTTLGKLNAEAFYDGPVRIEALKEAEAFLAARFAERGFKVEKLLLRNFQYAENYERSLRDKKVAVQLTEKNRRESLVNEEKAKLRQIESKGNAAITIAESEIEARISRIKAEAELYASQTRARADKEVGVAQAEAKRLEAEALTHTGGRNVVALEMAQMFDNIDGAVMTPEQYVAFVRALWSLLGVGVAPGAEVKK